MAYNETPTLIGHIMVVFIICMIFCGLVIGFTAGYFFGIKSTLSLVKNHTTQQNKN
jgi:hypothetical protein